MASQIQMAEERSGKKRYLLYSLFSPYLMCQRRLFANTIANTIANQESSGGQKEIVINRPSSKYRE